MTYGEAFTVQPFGNSLVTKTMTGDMIRRLLQQQFSRLHGGTAPAPVASCRSRRRSSTSRYRRHRSDLRRQDRPDVGQRRRGAADRRFRVTMNNFLATGGDGFTVFNEGTDSLGGAQDIDAWVAYFATLEPGGVPVPALDRIVAKP